MSVVVGVEMEGMEGEMEGGGSRRDERMVAERWAGCVEGGCWAWSWRRASSSERWLGKDFREERIFRVVGVDVGGFVRAVRVGCGGEGGSCVC